MEHRKFSYGSLDEVAREQERVGTSFPMNPDTACLKTPLKAGTFRFANRLGTAPMEGNDSEENGAPSESTFRRYRGLSEGGAAVIWMEAVAVVPEGRSGRGQLLLNQETLPAFQRLNEEIREAGRKKHGFAPVIIMQANHSGRYAKPSGVPAPMIAYHHPVYERTGRLDDRWIVTDDYLERLEEIFGEAAFLCRKAGFDAMDVKSCHGYLFAELASAYTRSGKFGGDFEYRFRLFLNSVRNAKAAETEQFMITARVGIYDGFEYPYGFGVREGGGLEPDYTEAVRLTGILYQELGMPFLNITMGNPYVNPHVTRPFDMGKYIPPEHPFEGIDRMYHGTGVIKKAYPGLVVSASAPSYLRQFAPALAAGAVSQGLCDMVLFGRETFADPDFVDEILSGGTLERNHTCVTCGKCGDLIRAGLPAGCVVRNPSEYLQYYKMYMGGERFE